MSTGYYGAENDRIEDETETVEVDLYIEDAGWVRPKEVDFGFTGVAALARGGIRFADSSSFWSYSCCVNSLCRITLVLVGLNAMDCFYLGLFMRVMRYEGWSRCFQQFVEIRFQRNQFGILSHVLLLVEESSHWPRNIRCLQLLDLLSGQFDLHTFHSLY